MDILLVEDNPADVRLVREALAEGEVQAELHWLASGEEALHYLRHTGAHAQVHATPDLVLLDLNLPGLHGQEVLMAIKQDPALLHIPVVVLSSSANPSDVQAAYGHYANAYQVKPQDYDEFLALVGSLRSYWLTSVLLPGRLA
jgi:chemotaxis family two-component system response regulator Rcp1